ncbi:hypothetical protein AAY473_019795 [Plecturocebus cupreus]
MLRFSGKVSLCAAGLHYPGGASRQRAEPHGLRSCLRPLDFSAWLTLSQCGQIKWDAVSHGMKSQKARYLEITAIPLYCRKEFLEREDKDSLCCKRSPKLKIEELNVPLTRELETMTVLSSQVDAQTWC